MEQIVYFSGKVKELNKFLRMLYTIPGKIVAVDIDNSLINVNKELERLGYDINLYPNPELTEDFWTSREGVDILLNAELISITVNFAASFIKLGAEVVFVTSRSEELKLLTEEWLQKYFPGFEVYFTKEKHLLDADIYLEDDPQQIQKIISLNKTVLIPEWPYNRDLFKVFEKAIYYNI
ncbi:MAG TPA: hypothetical protein GX516_01745 [Thermoanaerobacter sp.]|nr:hypothetical protein [Thermoanaerobacter sp.]